MGRIGHHLYQRHRLAYQLVPFVSEEFEGRVARSHDHRHAFRFDLQLKYAVPGLLEEGSKPLLALVHGSLDPFALGHVAGHCDDEPLPGWIQVAGLARDDRVHFSAGPVAQKLLAHALLAGLKHAEIRFPEDRGLLLGERSVSIVEEDDLSRAAIDRAKCIIDEHEAPPLILDEDRVRDRVDDSVEEGCR